MKYRRVLFLFMLLCLFNYLTAIPNLDDYTAANAATALAIPSYHPSTYGQHEVLHPDVVYVASGWNGYKYWMAFTPYPNQNAVYENPSIVASNNNIDWVVPTGLTNPIDLLEISSDHYNSDPELIFSQDMTTLYCIWREYYRGQFEALYYRSSTDGVTWSNRVLMHSISAVGQYYTYKESLLSASIIYHEGKYQMWSVHRGSSTVPRNVIMWEANSLTGPWTQTANQPNIGPITYNAGSPYTETWHINVIYHNGYYWMINCVGYFNISDGGFLYLGYSPDGYTWTFGSNPLISRTNNWDRIPYRASILPMNSYSNNFMIWYSSNRKEWDRPCQIGYTSTAGGEETLPIELSSFDAVQTPQNDVNIRWSTHSETDIMGYYIYRNDIADFNTATLVSPMIEANNSSTGGDYAYLDSEAELEVHYSYWLQSQNFGNESEIYGPIRIYMTDGEPVTPPVNGEITRITNIYPNPFNPLTNIRFDVSKAGDVDVRVYSLKGTEVAKIVANHFEKGTYTCQWNGKDADGNILPSGVYLMKLVSGSSTSMQKVVILK